MNQPMDELQLAEQQRAGSGMTQGMEFLEDKSGNVTAPIKYADGIVDLKWLLRMLLSGRFGINFRPAQAAVPPGPRPPGEGEGASENVEAPP